MGAGQWADVDRSEAPEDTAWQPMEGGEASAGPLGHVDGLVPGLPALAMGVSPALPGRLFVKRRDGETCAWILERPRSGLYLVIMQWLRPWVAVSPQLWLVMNDQSWPAVVEQWRTLSEFVQFASHEHFEVDRPRGVFEAAEEAARQAGSEEPFRLGGLSAKVETTLWMFADRARQADAFRRRGNALLGDPEEILRAALAGVHEALRSETVDRICRADDGTIGFYAAAREALAAVETPFGGAAVIRYAIERAQGRAAQAGAYLYGTFRSRQSA